MSKDLFFILLFGLNIGAMVFVALDTLRRNRKTPPATPTETSEEVTSGTKKAGVGKSKFSIEEARRRGYAAVDDYLETLDVDDVEFDESTQTPAKPAALSPEETQKAFETDQRIAKEIADSDDSVAEPMASGMGFDELARAEVILGKKTEPSAEEHKYVVRVFADFKDTELMTKIPQALLDKLELCHKKVAEMDAPKSEKFEPKLQQPVIKGYAEFSLADFLPKSNH